MSDQDEEKCPPCEGGSPAWMGTFADLMSLLMCFFVLLLSFSEMDAMKFKRLAGSMAQAFGVQNQLKLTDIPKGTSIIAQEFSPGRPEPTPINEIYQKTDNITEMTLDVDCAQEYDLPAGVEQSERGVSSNPQETLQQIKQLVKETEQDAVDIAKSLTDQIAKGEVEVETKGRRIIVRIRERGSFQSGSAELSPDYVPILQDVRNILANKKGTISIQGHTDNIPIETARFRSNWDLSAARAVSVAEELLLGNVLDRTRLQVSGFADTRPLAANDTAEGRARNRRVEIVIEQGLSEEVQQNIQVLKERNPELLQTLEQQTREVFELRPSEVF